VVVALVSDPSPARIVELFSARDIDGWTDEALAEDLVELRRSIDLLEAEFARRLRRFEAQRGYLSERAASLVAWLRNRCRMSAAAAAQQAEVARRVPELPETGRALEAGEIGFHHAAVIARCATEVGASEVRRVEMTLVDAARKLDPGRLRLVTRHLRHCVDPDGALDAANDEHERRWLSISQTYGGLFVIDGQLDAEGGALVRAAINALDTPAKDEDRTPRQRRADALVELVRRQLQGGTLPEVAGQRPHVTLTASVETLQHAPGAPAAELSWAGPVPAETARRVACDASVTRVTLDASGEPIGVGRTSRTVPPAMRRALAVRDKGCRFPGCDRPPEWTDAHHRRHWADGGETKLDNLLLLCRRHHRVVHELGCELGCELAAAPP